MEGDTNKLLKLTPFADEKYGVESISRKQKIYDPPI